MPVHRISSSYNIDLAEDKKCCNGVYQRGGCGYGDAEDGEKCPLRRFVLRKDGIEDMNETKNGRCEAWNVEDVKSEDPTLADDCNDKGKHVTKGEDSKGGWGIRGWDEDEKAVGNQ